MPCVCIIMLPFIREINILSIALPHIASIYENKIDLNCRNSWIWFYYQYILFRKHFLLSSKTKYNILFFKWHVFFPGCMAYIDKRGTLL